MTATVVAVWLILAAGYGVFFSFSIFMVPLLEEFRWSRALTAGALSVSTLLQGLLAPLVGIAVDRLGPRPVILAGVFSLSTASILAATIRTPWELYLYTGVVSGIGMVALGWVPMGVLLSRWVVERRGWVVGVAFSGMGMGVFVLGPLAQALIDTVGWRGATAILGVSIMMVVFPVAWWGCRDPKNPRQKPAHDAASSGTRAGDRAAGEERGGERSSDHDLGSPGYRVRSSQPSPFFPADPGRERVSRTSPHPVPPRPRDVTLADALRTRAFWALFAAYFMTPLAVFPIVTHQVAFAVDIGFPRLLVASIFGVLGLMSVVGRVVFGLLADRAGGAQAATLSYACTAAGAVALIAAESWPHTGWLIMYALLFGLGFGARGPIITAIASDLFGGARFGVIWGALNLSNGVGGAIGPWYGGLVHDVMGSYRLVFLSSIVFSALGSLCFWLARRRAP